MSDPSKPMPRTLLAKLVRLTPPFITGAATGFLVNSSLFRGIDQSAWVIVAILVSSAAFSIACTNIWGHSNLENGDKEVISDAKQKASLDSGSTQRIGPLPEHFNQLVALVKPSNHKVLIMTDAVDYGSVSTPESH